MMQSASVVASSGLGSQFETTRFEKCQPEKATTLNAEETTPGMQNTFTANTSNTFSKQIRDASVYVLIYISRNINS